MYINHQPFLIIISSPSGAGKSTLCKMLANNDPLIKLSISATTRDKRPEEIEGQHYFFKSKDEFKKDIEDNQFLEYAVVFNNYYGTPKHKVETELKNGHCVLFDIDWQGARKIKEKFDNSIILSIFILPPSLQELERRLKVRAQDPIEVVLKRMKEAKSEISHYNEYDYVLINDDLNKTYQKIFSIIDSKRIQMQNKNDLEKFIKEFS